MSDNAGSSGGPPSTGPTPSSGTFSSGPARKNNRRFNSSGKGQGQAPQQHGPRGSSKKFDGKVEGLKGYIYDCSTPQDADRYVKTTKEIAEYVGREYHGGKDIKIAVERGKMPTIPVPSVRFADPSKPTETEKLILKEKVKEHVKRERILEENMSKLFNLIKGQCTEAMTASMEAHAEYEKAHEDNDGLKLLTIVKAIAFNFQHKKLPSLSIHQAKKRFFTLFQNKEATVAQYYDTFKNTLDVLEAQGGSIGDDDGIRRYVAKTKKIDFDAASEDELVTIVSEARDMYLAVAFLSGADRGRYQDLMTDLENNFAQGFNKYPSTLVEAYELLVRWKPLVQRSSGTQGQSGRHQSNQGTSAGLPAAGAAFTTIGNKPHIKCFRCGNHGHYRGDAICPEAANDPGYQNESINVQTSGSTEDNDTGVQMLTATLMDHDEPERYGLPSTPWVTQVTSIWSGTDPFPLVGSYWTTSRPSTCFTTRRYSPMFASTHPLSRSTPTQASR